MRIFSTGFWTVPGLFYDIADNGGGGMDGGADPAGGADPGVAEPDVPIELDENRLIKVKGSDKPVKFGEHVRGFQSQFTKASQEAARLKEQLAAERNRIAQFEREKAQWSQQQQAGQPRNDIMAQLEQLPYLDGKSAAQLVQSIGQQLQQRDQIMLTALNQMREMKATLSGLNQNHVNTSFDNKIRGWLKEGGYPDDPSVTELAKEIYLAYTGDDLDQEFPQMFQQRWESLNRVLETQRAQKVAAARKQPFIPGRGGQAGPSKPLQFKGSETPQEIAATLWNEIQGSET
jgi:hypothetical protein